MSSCKCIGPGWSSPQEAFEKGEREKLLYIPAIIPDHSRPDYLVTIDCDLNSESYSQVIHRLELGVGDELHHSGWNACSSCYGDISKRRSHLILPALGSGKIYAVDTFSDPGAPKLGTVVTAEEIQSATGLSYLHTSHCLADGNIMVSAMGDPEGRAKGDFILIDGDTYKVKGTWSEFTNGGGGGGDGGVKPVGDGRSTTFGYDYWYQPRLNVMVSSGWGAPEAFSKGFNPADVAAGKYCSKIWFWDWSMRKVVQEVDLGPEGAVPLEVRFLHEPTAPHGYVGCALASNVIHFTKSGETGTWETKVAIRQEALTVEGWALPSLPPLITDILISMDDKFLFFSNWLRGDLAVYNIEDPATPTFVNRIWLGGAAREGTGIKVLAGLPDGMAGESTPAVTGPHGKELGGGPQMLQLSLDGKRLYVTNSLYTPWDKQFYPDMVKKGGYLLLVDFEAETGNLTLNDSFFVDFGEEPGGPALAHEVRYPGGDCSSDIWM